MIDEKSLLKDLQSDKNKEVAFKALLSQYKERLYWHIRKIVIDHDDADDIVQNTFIKVFRNINSFKGESKIYTWMYRIATNEALNFLNKQSKMKNILKNQFKKK